MREFVEKVVSDSTGPKACLIIEAWSRQKDPSMFALPGKTISVETLPAGSTPYVQPGDVAVFRMWEDFIKRVTEQVMLNNVNIKMHDRNMILTVFD